MRKCSILGFKNTSAFSRIDGGVLFKMSFVGPMKARIASSVMLAVS